MAKQDTPTPIEDALGDWQTRYGLTPAEREVLFVVATGTYSLAAVARDRETTLATVKAQTSDICKKTGDRRITHAALRLNQEALRLATFDKERRDGKNGATHEEYADE